eukprot:TRINITY_DN10704_c0_g1_i1.p1 TRINITY_DN10704_c0_g1~~TRINITY_DN10704_c0_g1_i1.p1  ORF type:complete len:568 (+),score=69.65 TRINITY_DN10704_c0_g1_i1:49-1752(+)
MSEVPPHGQTEHYSHEAVLPQCGYLVLPFHHLSAAANPYGLVPVPQANLTGQTQLQFPMPANQGEIWPASGLLFTQPTSMPANQDGFGPGAAPFWPANQAQLGHARAPFFPTPANQDESDAEEPTQVANQDRSGAGARRRRKRKPRKGFSSNNFQTEVMTAFNEGSYAELKELHGDKPVPHQPGLKQISSDAGVLPTSEETASIDTDKDDPSLLSIHIFKAQVVKEQLEQGTNQNREKLIKWMLPALPSLSKTQLGCRVVQQVIRNCSNTESAGITEALCHVSPELAECPYGIYVLGALVETFEKTDIDRILEFFPGRWPKLLRQKHASRFCEKLLIYWSDRQEVQNGLIPEILNDVESLCQLEYGNHVVGKALEQNELYMCVLEKMLPNISKLAVQKYGSYSVERALTSAEDLLGEQALEAYSKIAEAFLEQDPLQEFPTLQEIACSKWGHRVAKQLANNCMSDELFTQIYLRLKGGNNYASQNEYYDEVLAEFNKRVTADMMFTRQKADPQVKRNDRVEQVMDFSYVAMEDHPEDQASSYLQCSDSPASTFASWPHAAFNPILRQ